MGKIKSFWRYLLGPKNMVIKSKPSFDNYNYKNLFKEIRKALASSIYLCDNKSVAIDAGAHLGIASKFLSHSFQEVHAFEPLWHDHLKENLKEYNNVKIYNHALGQHVKKERIWIAKHNVGGSSMVPLKERLDKWMRNAESKEVDVFPLDYFNFKEVNFIKIDVESYEYEVIKGAENLINEYKPVIQVELLNKYRDELPNDKIKDLLKSFGYKLECRVQDDYIWKHK